MNPILNQRTRAVPAAALLLAASALALVIAGSAFGQALTPNYRDTDLRQVIEAVGAVTGRNFLVDQRVRGQVTLISNSPMSEEAFYEAFLATLSVNGFVALDDGDVVRIVPDANARQMPGAEPGGADDDFVTQVIRLENVGAAQLVPILRPLIPQYGHLAAHQTSNMLIIVDREANVQRMLDIVDRMDRAATEDVEVIRLENAFAGEIVQTLSTLSQASQAAGGAPTVQAIADNRTNSILLSGSETGRLRYRGLIAFLDTPSQTGGDSRVRYLNYAESEDLATKLQTQFGGATAAPAEGGAVVPGEGDVSIWADPATNALVINAPARVMQDMMSVIDKIDIRRAQVAVDAIIVEMSEEKAAELGVSWITDGSDDNSIIGLTNFGSTTPGVVQLGTAASADTPSAAAIPEGVLLGVGRIRDAGTSWAAIVSALAGDATTNVIATPHITVLDNEEAEITVGQEVPFLTGSFTNTGGGGDGAVNPFQTIQREEVGTRLRIIPQINEGSGLKLTLEQETSSISAGAAGAVDLVTNNRTITTSVFVDDGEVLVLGGLMDDQLRQSEQRVPGLGRIPGLGWLFRARNTERVKTNLMVFIRPRILRDSVQAGFETNAKYNYIRELQRQQAEEPVRLMRDETPPVLPELESAPVPSAPEPDDGEDGNAP